jgi:hypothetical protein
MAVEKIELHFDTQPVINPTEVFTTLFEGVYSLFGKKNISGKYKNYDINLTPNGKISDAPQKKGSPFKYVIFYIIKINNNNIDVDNTNNISIEKIKENNKKNWFFYPNVSAYNIKTTSHKKRKLKFRNTPRETGNVFLSQIENQVEEFLIIHINIIEATKKANEAAKLSEAERLKAEAARLQAVRERDEAQRQADHPVEVGTSTKQPHSDPTPGTSAQPQGEEKGKEISIKELMDAMVVFTNSVRTQHMTLQNIKDEIEKGNKAMILKRMSETANIPIRYQGQILGIENGHLVIDDVITLQKKKTEIDAEIHELERDLGNAAYSDVERLHRESVLNGMKKISKDILTTLSNPKREKHEVSVLSLKDKRKMLKKIKI